MPDDAMEREHWSRQSIAGIVIEAITASKSGKGTALPAGRAADEILTLLAPAFASQQAPGMVLVPREPTHDMLHGAMTASRLSDPSPLPSCKELWAAGQVWSAMLDAAPSVTLGEVG